MTKKLIIIVLFFLSAYLTFVQGEIPWNTVWEGVLTRFNGGHSLWNPLLDERLPRLIVILCTGAALAVSGVVMQALFQNPLAAPSVLGISCGGCLCAVPVFILQWHIDYPFAIPVAALAGCLLTLLIVYALSKQNGKVHMDTLILIGISVSTVLLALQATLLYAFRDRWQLIQMVTEWMAGSTADRSWKHVHMQLPLTLIGLWGCWSYRNELNLLSLGEEEAYNLGVEVDTLRWRLFLCVAILTGGAIAAVGIIAFYGLVLPHIVRRVWGSDCKFLLLYSMICGALVLSILDLFLRMFQIHFLSIGNVSALLGGLFFLFLLTTRAKRNYIYASR